MRTARFTAWSMDCARRRSPGSAVKPFVYGLALDQGLIHPRSLLTDGPMVFNDYNPENFEGEFMGPIHANDALVRSRNIPAVALANRLGDGGLYQLLQARRRQPAETRRLLRTVAHARRLRHFPGATGRALCRAGR